MMGIDYSSIYGAVNFTQVLSGIGVVGAALATVAVAFRGARMLLSFIRR